MTWTRADTPFARPPRPVVVFALSLALIEVVEAYFRRFTDDGVHFQAWTSEVLMQSISVRELARAPVESLWYLHIQPPIYNLIRAVLAAFHPGAAGVDLIRAVDRDLYHVWALAGAALVALIDTWLRKLRVPPWLSAVLALGWLLHPANLGYLTLLDGTLLSALLTTWILYETWLFTTPSGGSLRRLIAAVLLAYFTRSVFQWPFLLVMLSSLALMRVPPRALVTFAGAVGFVMALYSVKQFWLFGTVTTSTFEGTNLTNAIGADCSATPAPAPLAARSKAAVLTEPQKIDGSQNFNHLERLEYERKLAACFRHSIATLPPTALWADYVQNFQIYLRPSSSYRPNAIVDRLPWREPFDSIFSGVRLHWLMLGAGALGLWRLRRRPRAAFAIALPFAYVLMVSVIGDRGENMRFKFFLEPSLYVLLAMHVHRVAGGAVALAEIVSRRFTTLTAGASSRS